MFRCGLVYVWCVRVIVCVCVCVGGGEFLPDCVCMYVCACV